MFKSTKLNKLINKIPDPILKRLPLILFISCFLIYTFLTYKKFGITWDETDVYNWGKANINYYAGKPTTGFDLLNGLEGYYYNFYASVVILISFVFKQFNSFEFYHLVNLVFSLPIFIAAYEIILKYYKKTYLAVLAPIFLFLTPRFFNDIAANPKDIPFAVVYFVALALIYLLFNKGLFTKALFIGLAFGVVQSERVLGFGIYVIYIAYALVNYFIENKFNKKEFISYLIIQTKELILITIVAFCFMFATWPAVGANSTGGLIHAITLPKTFQWNGEVLFSGSMVNIRQIPDVYLPVWFVITTPVFILTLLAATIVFIKRLVKNKLFILFGLALILNLVAYLVLNPVIYNGIRHFLFIYPITTLLALLVFIEVIKYLKSKDKTKKYLAYAFVIFTCLNTCLILLSYAILFPYGYIYFNELSGGLKTASESFESDYWATATKEGAEWLNANTDNTTNYIVSSYSSPNQVQYFLKANLIYVDNANNSKADYYLAKDLTILNSRKGRIIHAVGRASTTFLYIIQFDK